MSQFDPVFHVLTQPDITVAALCAMANGELGAGTDGSATVVGLSSAYAPRPGTLVYLKSIKGCDLERLTMAAAVLVDSATATQLPPAVQTIIASKPQSAFAGLARALYPASLGNAQCFRTGDEPLQKGGALISRHAHIEDGVLIEPGAVIGDHVAIGAGSRIGANTVIAHSCQIGRHCEIGSNVSLQYALLGDKVILHPGVRVGQEGFGFVPGATGLEKVPQLGRVIIQNDVEIGANSTIDRGALDDTVIGEGTKIDNQVQIAHNVVIGRSCAIAAQCGISGSARIGDQCMLGGGVGIADHMVIGNRVQIAASSGVMNDIPDGEKWGGAPAQPLRAFFREQATLRRLAKPNKS